MAAIKAHPVFTLSPFQNGKTCKFPQLSNGHNSPFRPNNHSIKDLNSNTQTCIYQFEMKPNAILNNRRLHEFTTVFRFMETFFFLAMISRFSSQLPFAVKLTGDYFRESSFSICSPKFVFVIGNIIILILFLRSRVVENNDMIGNADFYYEYAKSCDRSVVNCTESADVVVSSERRVFRSKSEDLISVNFSKDEIRRELRRTVTEIRRPAVKSKVTDEESCEDFRRTVEAFIERRRKILRDEEL